MGLGGAIIWVPSPVSPPASLAGTTRVRDRYRRRRHRGWHRLRRSHGAFLRSGEQDVWQTLYRIELCIALIVIVSAFVFLRSQGNGHRWRAGSAASVRCGRSRWKALTGAYRRGLPILVISLPSPLEDDAGWTSSAALAFTTIGFAVIAGGLIVGSISTGSGAPHDDDRVRFVGGCSSGSHRLAPVVLVSTVLVGIMFSGIPATIIAHVVAHADDGHSVRCSRPPLAFGIAQRCRPRSAERLPTGVVRLRCLWLAAAAALIGAMAAWSLPRTTSKSGRCAHRFLVEPSAGILGVSSATPFRWSHRHGDLDLDPAIAGAFEVVDAAEMYEFGALGTCTGALAHRCRGSCPGSHRRVPR